MIKLSLYLQQGFQNNIQKDYIYSNSYLIKSNKIYLNKILFCYFVFKTHKYIIYRFFFKNFGYIANRNPIVCKTFSNAMIFQIFILFIINKIFQLITH
jgi:hypothetical protein